MTMKKISINMLLLILIDQISKFIITLWIPYQQEKVVIPSLLNLTYVKNTGAAFSILEGNQTLFILITIFVLIVGVYFIYNKPLEKGEIVIYSLIGSGIIGNLIDRVIHKYVIDFISIIIFNYHFAIFNLADAFIVIGVILYIILIGKEELKCKK